MIKAAISQYDESHHVVLVYFMSKFKDAFIVDKENLRLLKYGFDNCSKQIEIYLKKHKE